jgi:seryl-tRNA synthetase
MQRRTVPRTDPRYNQVRARNNDSVKKSREKSRRERDETVEAINQLEEENGQLMKQIQMMKQEYQQMQDLFQKHTGISLDQAMSSQTTSAPKPIEESKEPPPHPATTSKPVLTINTNEDQSSTAAASDVQLDPSTLDGAIVLINGVQYKIVSMNKT